MNDFAMGLRARPEPITDMGSRPMRLSEAIGMLSYALDLTEGQPPGHSVRCCWIGMRIGRRLGLAEGPLADLYYTLLLKDTGCSSNAARLWQLYGGDDRILKHAVKTVDTQRLMQLGRFVLRHSGPGEALRARMQRVFHLMSQGDALANEVVLTRCERGANIVRRIGFSDAVAQGVYCLDEHWNGRGRSVGLAGEAIPISARIALLAQVIDVFNTLGGRRDAEVEARRRSGSWFDPAVVAAFEAEAKDPLFWEAMDGDDLDERITALEPVARVVHIDAERLDVIAEAFADVIDAKSSFTGGHSQRVTQYAEAVAVRLGLPETRRRWLRRAALLHDIGKLGVSSGILDKPARLDASEMAAMQHHATMSEEILQRLSVFSDLAPVAASHHERLDGTGYPKRIGADRIALETRIITVADIFDALTAGRPYRGPTPTGEALRIMQGDVGSATDPRCFGALADCVPAFGLPA